MKKRKDEGKKMKKRIWVFFELLPRKEPLVEDRHHRQFETVMSLKRQSMALKV